MTEATTFRLNCLGGKLMEADDLPKLPPAAYKLMLQNAKEAGVNPSDMNEAEAGLLLVGMAVDLVHMTVKRIDPAITLEEIDNNEDGEEVMACFRAIKERNPSLFPEAPAAEEPEKDEPEDPTTARSEQSTKPSAPSKS